MARTDPQFNLRVPAELKQQVEEAAKLSGRSINAEAVYRLEQSFKNINKSLDDLSSLPIRDFDASLSRLAFFSIILEPPIFIFYIFSE